MGDDGYPSFADGIKSLLEECIASLQSIRLRPVGNFSLPEMVSINMLMALEPATIAMYLTHYDFEVFQKIQVWRNCLCIAAWFCSFVD
jgi:hypothetical protein